MFVFPGFEHIVPMLKAQIIPDKNTCEWLKAGIFRFLKIEYCVK